MENFDYIIFEVKMKVRDKFYMYIRQRNYVVLSSNDLC